MKLIPLSQGLFAKVDDEDYEWLNQWKWCALEDDNTFYAMRRAGKTILMHSIIMQTPVGMEVDHKNYNGLDNRRENLRLCTRSQNQHNKSSTNTYGRGVQYYSGYGKKKYRAKICKDYKCTYSKCFHTALEAAAAYNKMAIELFGEFACLNDLSKVQEYTKPKPVERRELTEEELKIRNVFQKLSDSL